MTSWVNTTTLENEREVDVAIFATMLFGNVVPRGDRGMSSSFATLREGFPCIITIHEVMKIPRVVLPSCFNNKH